jgi:hypothetical protein
MGIGVVSNIPVLGQFLPDFTSDEKSDDDITLKLPFIPVRAASWWCDIEDLLWSQKKVVDKIKFRAEAFAKAKIDTAINFGFHIRFDFSNYFGQLHGYYANVCEELHKYDIRFLDHYSCNHVERPRGKAEVEKLHKMQRHHILLFHDPVSAGYAQYEGHFFKDLCEISLHDGSRGYAKQYQLEIFCQNNPGFIDMHRKYLSRLLDEVPLDGLQVDDMCDYAGLVTCGCKYCRDRFKKEYNFDLPGLDDTGFWGDIKGRNEFQWGNYENPAFRSWIKMKADSVADHLKMVKEVTGNRPLMTCCSSSGPVYLNSIALNLENMSPYLDLFMLENCGINVNSVDWVRMDSEALHQKDIAAKKNNAPALALSYTIYEKGGYLGWSLSRFWGVANWSSTLNQRLEEDPPDMMLIEDIIDKYNNWELKNSNLNYRIGEDLVEVRLVNSRYCRENGWRGTDGQEQWDKAAAWSSLLVKSNIGYRFVRCEELSDPDALCRDNTPLILDSVGSVSDSQFKAIKKYLSAGGQAWMALPFGTHDETGNKRAVPLSSSLLKAKYKNLLIINSVSIEDPLEKLIRGKRFHPVLTQISGDTRWAVRIRFYEGRPVLHFLSRGLIAIPHPSIKDMGGVAVLKDIDSEIKDNKLSYEIDSSGVAISSLAVLSPETGNNSINAEIRHIKNDRLVLNVNLEGIKIYAVAQNIK